MKKEFFYLLVICFLGRAFSQVSGPERTVDSVSNRIKDQYGKLEQDSLVQWQEHVIVHLDNKIYQPNETILFKVYIQTGPNKTLISASNVLRIELLDSNGSIILGQFHKVVNGMASGTVTIPKKLDTGDYFLRAYTQWMLNYGPSQLATKRIVIGNPTTLKKKRERFVDFYPEGGHMVADLPNRLIITSSTSLVEGNITDVSNRKVSNVVGYGKGIGVVDFVPELGKKYFYGTLEERVELPIIRERGFVLRASNLSKDVIHVTIQGNGKTELSGVKLRGVLSGTTYFENLIDFDDNSYAEREISKKKLQNGILRIQLVNEFDQVLAERPAIIEKKELNISVEPLDAETISVVIRDTLGNPVHAYLSVGIRSVDVADSFFIEDGTDTTRGHRFMADLLLLSHSPPDEMVQGRIAQLPKSIKYPFQKGIDFVGQAYDLNNTVLANKDIQIMVTTEANVIVREVATDSKGIFRLKNLQFDGEAVAVFRTAGTSTDANLVKVVQYSYEVPPVSLFETKTMSDTLRTFQEEAKGTNATAEPKEKNALTLEGVTVISERKNFDTAPRLYNIEPSRSVKQDVDHPKTIPQLLMKIPGVIVSGIGGIAPKIYLPKASGNGSLLWVLDGMPIGKTNDLRDIIGLISHVDVERIDLLLGPNAAIFGTRAAGGVMLIYSRRGNHINYFNRKAAQLSVQGFCTSETFLSKKYSTNMKEAEGQTIYWNSGLQTDANGKVRIEINADSNPAKLVLELMAVTTNGKLGVLKKVINK